MHKLLCRNLTTKRPPTNFTSIYRKVAKNHATICKSDIEDKEIKRNHTEERCDEETAENLSSFPKQNSHSPAGKKTAVKLLMRSLIPDQSFATFSTTTRKHFYSSSSNYKRDSDHKFKPVSNENAFLYQSGIEQCMKIKYNRQRLLKQQTNKISIAPQPYRTSSNRDEKFAKRVKSEEIVARIKPVADDKHGHTFKDKRKIYLEKSLPSVPKKKFRIVYPTHRIRYKITPDKNTLTNKLIGTKKSVSKLEAVTSAEKKQTNFRYVVGQTTSKKEMPGQKESSEKKKLLENNEAAIPMPVPLTKKSSGKKKVASKSEENKNPEKNKEYFRYRIGQIPTRKLSANKEAATKPKYVIPTVTLESMNNDRKETKKIQPNKKPKDFSKVTVDSIKLCATDHTISFLPPKTIPDEVKPGTLKLFNKISDHGKQHISLHPSIKKFSQHGKMAINKKYNAILMRNQKPVQLKQWKVDIDQSGECIFNMFIYT